MTITLRGLGGRARAMAGTGAMLCVLGSIGAQAQFQADYGGAGDEFGGAVHQNSNGAYIVTGEAPSPFALGRTDVYVIITNPLSEFPMVEQTYNLSNGNDFGTDIQETTVNGLPGYIVTGYTQPGDDGNADIFLMKLDQLGTPIWCRLYSDVGVNLNDEAYHLEVTPTGYVVSGRSTSNHASHFDAVIFKTDTAGNLLWGNAYDGASSSYEGFYSNAVLPNGDHVACGATTIGGDNDVLVARISAAGVPMWQRRYGVSGSDQGSRSIRAGNPNGPNNTNLIIAGNTGGSLSLAMLVSAATGNFTSARSYNAGNGWQEAMGVVEDPTNNYSLVFTGLNAYPPNGYGSIDFYLQRVSATLLNQWYRIQGGQWGGGDDRGWAVDLALPFNGTNAATIIATGMMTTPNAQQDLHLTRTDQFGLTSANCLTRTLAPVATTINWTPINMPAPHRWGLALTRVTPQVYEYARDPWHCDGPLFNIVPIEPAGDALNPSLAGGHNDNAGSALGSATSGVESDNADAVALTAYPNPVVRGGSFVLDYVASSGATVSVTVSDMAGRVIHTADLGGGAMRLPIRTEGWPSGSYLVRLSIDGVASTRRMVVTN